MKLFTCYFNGITRDVEATRAEAAAAIAVGVFRQIFPDHVVRADDIHPWEKTNARQQDPDMV